MHVGSVISIAPSLSVFTLLLRPSLSTLRLHQQCTQHQDSLEYIAPAPAVCAALAPVVEHIVLAPAVYAEDRGEAPEKEAYDRRRGGPLRRLSQAARLWHFPFSSSQ